MFRHHTIFFLTAALLLTACADPDTRQQCKTDSDCPMGEVCLESGKCQWQVSSGETDAIAPDIDPPPVPDTDTIEPDGDSSETDIEDTDTSDTDIPDTTNECPVAQASASIRNHTRVWQDALVVADVSETVILDGTGSNDPDGDIARYEWRLVKKPATSETRLNETDNPGRRALKLDSAGMYVALLEVTDNEGKLNCEGAERVRIEANSAKTISVELTWDNPSDPAPKNNCGPDLDLHYLHEKGTWKHSKWDIYYNNRSADWGESGPENNPTLTLNDNSGGPEVLEHTPSNGTAYDIGVTYFRASQPLRAVCPDVEPGRYGPSYATVRVYIDDELTYEYRNKMLKKEGMFWHVAEILPNRDLAEVDELYDEVPSSPN
jgi:hypothetical protein